MIRVVSFALSLAFFATAAAAAGLGTAGSGAATAANPASNPPATSAPNPDIGPATGLPADPGDKNTAVLQALDKITARITTIKAPVGKVVHFGALDILVRRCHARPPTEPPESTAYLEITEHRPDEPSKKLFAGWMFSSSPAVSSMQDPVYDVWVVACKNVSSSP